MEFRTLLGFIPSRPSNAIACWNYLHCMSYATLASCLFSVFLCACTRPASSTGTDQALPPTQDTSLEQGTDPLNLVLPERIRDLWEPTPENRWDAYWEEEYADSTGSLGHRSADFTGDGTVDQAFFLTRKDTARRDSAYALVILFDRVRDTVLTVEPWAEAEGHIGMGLTLEPPGMLGHLGGEEGGEPEGQVNLKQSAITLVYFEKASITWYWKDGSFHKVWTGD